MSSQPPARPGRPRDPEKDIAVLDATNALLAESGYRALRIDDVAARANIPKSTIYRRWPSIDHLVVDTVIRSFPAPPSARGETPVEQLDNLVRDSIAPFMGDSLSRSVPLIGIQVMRDPDLSQHYRAVFVDPYEQTLTDIVERGIAAGDFHPTVAPHLAIATLLMTTSQVILIGDEVVTIDAVIAVAHALLGIAG